MRPTLEVGQRASVDVDAYRESGPQIGDVVLFYGPSDVVTISPADGAACVELRQGPSTARYIKRIVAGPRDVISIRRGLVVRNRITEGGDHLLLDHCEWSPDCELPEPVTVPEGTFYLLGDNRGQSEDSRHWGPIPADWIVGRIEIPSRSTPQRAPDAPTAASRPAGPVREPEPWRVPDEPPVIARGEVPGGSWTLHADYEPERPDGGGPSVYIQFYNGRGDPTEGGGVGGFDVASDAVPVQFILSRRGPASSFCYLGQTTERARTVELTLSDARVVSAELVDGELPMRLWLAFSDGTAVATQARALDQDGEFGRDEIEDAWPAGGTTCWIPDDD